MAPTVHPTYLHPGIAQALRATAADMIAAARARRVRRDLCAALKRGADPARTSADAGARLAARQQGGAL